MAAKGYIEKLMAMSLLLLVPLWVLHHRASHHPPATASQHKHSHDHGHGHHHHHRDTAAKDRAIHHGERGSDGPGHRHHGFQEHELSPVHLNKVMDQMGPSLLALSAGFSPLTWRVFASRVALPPDDPPPRLGLARSQKKRGPPLA